MSTDWVLKWIKDPHAFRPDSRMPRFYGVTNNYDQDDWPKNHAEIQRDHPLPLRPEHRAGRLRRSARQDRPGARQGTLPAEGLHGLPPAPALRPRTVQPEDTDQINPDYKPDPALTYDPENFPESVRQYAKADFGPNLSNIAAKFQSQGQGHEVAGQLDHRPRRSTIPRA